MADISKLKLLDGSLANIKDATSRSSLSGKVNIDQGVANAGKVLGIGQDGMVAPTTANVGTITGIKMNGVSKGTSGVVDLGTVLTAHQDISGKADLVDGKVPSNQLPSYVDDVLEYASLTNFPLTGEAGIIYIAIDTNKTYRWSGSAYVEISASLTLGTTSSTAYRGDYGNTAYSHATDSGRLTTAQSSGLYKFATTAQGHIASVASIQKSDITALGITDVPAVTSSDNGKVLRVVSGAWAAVQLPSASGVNF